MVGNVIKSIFGKERTGRPDFKGEAHRTLLDTPGMKMLPRMQDKFQFGYLGPETQPIFMKVTSSPSFIDALRRGERAAVSALYDEAFPKIAGYIQRNRGDEEQARDLFQDALVVLFQKLQESDFVLTAAPGTY